MEVTHLFSHGIYPKELSTPEHSSIVENKFTDTSVIDCDFTDEVTDVSSEKSNTNTTDPLLGVIHKEHAEPHIYYID